jgi:hypothetical protein
MLDSNRSSSRREQDMRVCGALRTSADPGESGRFRFVSTIIIFPEA